MKCNLVIFCVLKINVLNIWPLNRGQFKSLIFFTPLKNNIFKNTLSMSSTDLNYFVFLAANFMINCIGRKESLPGLELIKLFPIQIIWPIKTRKRKR